MANKVSLEPAQIKAPATRPTLQGDIPGLYLFPSTRAGCGKWILRFNSPQTGKRREMGLGAFPAVSVQTAKRQALIARNCLKNGQDPIERKKTDQRFSALFKSAPTFEVLAREYHKDIVKGFRNEKHCEQWLRTLEEYAFPSIGKISLDTLDARDLSACLKPIWLAKPVTARRIKQRCDAVMKWSIALGLTNTNPLIHVERLLPIQPSKRRSICHFPALPWKGIPSFISAVLHSPSARMHHVMLELIILTACRSGEIRKMRWEDIDFEAKIFTVPASRMKAGVAHRVPLTPRALELLSTRKQACMNCTGLVFRSSANTEVRDHALTNVLREHCISSDVANRFATTHGFRSSFRDWASARGFERSSRAYACTHDEKRRRGRLSPHRSSGPATRIDDRVGKFLSKP